MKKAADGKRKSNTRKVVNKRLLSYSVAAGAAVAMASPAQAAVIGSGPQNITVNPDDCFKIDLNGDMIDDFEFCLYEMLPDYIGVLFANVDNYVMVYPPKYVFATRLCGEVVPGDADWNPYGITHGTYYGNYGMRYGQFWGETGSIGVQFEVPGGAGPTMHYGYVRVSVDEDGKRAVIKDWAYESTPETPIMTPPCEEDVIPTLNQWGIFILMGLILLEGGRRLKRRKELDS